MRALCIVWLAIMLGGCVGALAGGTIGGSIQEYAVIDVTAVTPAGQPIAGATVHVEQALERPPVSTDAKGAATAYVNWYWHKRNPTDDAGEYHDAVLVIEAPGVASWRSVIRVRPARITPVRAALEVPR